jgi:uracil-DNA glycosylase
MKTWDEMSFWSTDEWLNVQERLDNLNKAHKKYCPKQEDLFAALDATPFEKVRVAIIAQDPYPNPLLATGIAFDIPKKTPIPFPPTLVSLFKEYERDLSLSRPTTGCLRSWCDQGVLLWNAIPSCEAGKSLSHDWSEWKLLTKEIVEALSSASVLIVFLGGKARAFLQYVDLLNSDVLVYSHPSPRGSLNSKNPFVGSYMFSTINDRLRDEGQTPINWRLP